MTTNIAIAAQLARPSVPSVLKQVIPTESESHLDQISNGTPITHVYRGESRPWWDTVDDDKVYEDIADERFQDFVREITATV